MGAKVLLVTLFASLIGAGECEAHHDDEDRHGPMSVVAELMQIARDGCFLRGADPKRLSIWAEHWHGDAAGTEQLREQSNPFTILIGGWTLRTGFGAVAVIQSEFREPQSGHVCSVTARLPEAEHHGEAKTAFQRVFATAIAEEKEAPDRHVDRFWIEREDKPPVRATIDFIPSNRIITIRMIHGASRPGRS
jgi:hypothetical protein